CAAPSGLLARHRYADDFAVKDHGVADETLDVEDRLPPVQLHRLGDEHEPVADVDDTAEANVLHAAEADKVALEQPVAEGEVAGELRRRLADHDARHERVARHVPAHPELVRTHVLVAGDDVVDRVLVDDGVELLHLEALRIDLAYGLLIRDHAAQVQLHRVVVHFGRHTSPAHGRIVRCGTSSADSDCPLAALLPQGVNDMDRADANEPG